MNTNEIASCSSVGNEDEMKHKAVSIGEFQSIAEFSKVCVCFSVCKKNI